MLAGGRGDDSTDYKLPTPLPPHTPPGLYCAQPAPHLVSLMRPMRPQRTLTFTSPAGVGDS